MNLYKKIDSIKNKTDLVEVFFEISNKIFNQQKSFVSIILSSEKNINEIKNKIKYIETRQNYFFNTDFLNKFNNELQNEKEKLNTNILPLLNQFNNIIIKEIKNDDEIDNFKNSIKNGTSIFSNLKNNALIDIVKKTDKKGLIYNSELESLIISSFHDFGSFITGFTKDLDKLKELNENIIDLWKVVDTDFKMVSNKENYFKDKIFFSEAEKNFLNLAKLKTINEKYNNVNNDPVEENVLNKENSLKEEVKIVVDNLKSKENINEDNENNTNLLKNIKNDLNVLEKDLKIMEKKIKTYKYGDFNIYC